jgi:hypothetical protein
VARANKEVLQDITNSACKTAKGQGLPGKETVGFMCERWDNFRGLRVKVARQMLKDFGLEIP